MLSNTSYKLINGITGIFRYLKRIGYHWIIILVRFCWSLAFLRVVSILIHSVRYSLPPVRKCNNEHVYSPQ